MTTRTSQRLTLTIDGMSCGHCVQAVTEALAALPSVKVRAVAVGSATVEVEGPSGASAAIRALDEAGYPARVAGVAGVAGAPGGSARAGGCCGGPTGCCG